MALSQVEFNRWVSEHGPALFRLAYRLVGDRHEAEDVVQEAFRSAWKSRQRFEPISVAGRDGDHAGGERAWLASILRRRVIDRWRRKGGLDLVSAEHIEVGVEADDPLSDDYTDEMQRALDCLPRELRETLLLVVVGELTHQEAADVLSVPLGTVLSRVSRARTKLRDVLLSNQAFRLPRGLDGP